VGGPRASISETRRSIFHLFSSFFTAKPSL
jgi:hypothetical protein